MPSVIVVGAGLAGLTAASSLSANGWDVIVFEARDRVGGRVWSNTFDNGATVELGGEWIHGDDRHTVALADQLGLELVDTRIEFTRRHPIGAPPIPAAEHRKVASALQREIARLTDQERATMSVDEVIGRVRSESPALAVLRSRLEGSAGMPLSRVGVEEVEGSFGISTGKTYRVVGGNDLLAKGLAATIVDVRLASPINAVEYSPNGVGVIDHRGQTHSADALIVAVPLPHLQSLSFEPGLPEALTTTIMRLQMGSAAKFTQPAKSNRTAIARQSIEIPAWFWTSGVGAVGAVTSFAGTEAGVASLVSEGAWRRLLDSAMPEVETFGTPIVTDWTAEEWSRGCYSALAPGHRSLLERFDHPPARVEFAGEHIFGSGTIDGAIRSGTRAAARIKAHR
jgi:monoamine oxidase